MGFKGADPVANPMTGNVGTEHLRAMKATLLTISMPFWLFLCARAKSNGRVAIGLQVYIDRAGSQANTPRSGVEN